MSLVMEDFKPSVSKLEEVKKLRDLVRKLEIQNMHLKNKQNMVSRKRSISPEKEAKSNDLTNHLAKKETSKSTSHESNGMERSVQSDKNEFVEDMEIIAISDIDLSDEESWLYTSPKAKANNQKQENLFKWLRKEVDDPENKQLQLTKRALLLKLNELEILSSPSQVQSTSHFPANVAVKNFRRPQLSYKQVSVHSEQGYIDTRTFTKSKKKQALEFLETLDMLENERNSDRVCIVPELHRRGSDISLDSVSSGHVLEDANDVQEVARMQEESLRLSSPIGTPKRSSVSSLSRKASISSKSSVSDLDVVESSANLKTSEVPKCLSEDGIAYAPNVSSLSYPSEPFDHSDQSSPSESPYSSNTSLNNNEGKKKATKLTAYRRSMPNLNRAATFTRQSKDQVVNGRKIQMPSSTRIVSQVRKPEASLQTQQKPRREMCPPPHRQRSQATSSSGSSYTESPKSSMHPPVFCRSAETQSRLKPRSGLPKPSRASSATRSRSGIPGPSTSSKRQEDSWSEGCF